MEVKGRMLTAVVALVCVWAWVCVLPPVTSGAARSNEASSAAPATVSLTGGAYRIPRAFLGLSVEYNELVVYEQEGPLFGQVLKLVGPGKGRAMLLRVGGKSADHAYWETAPASGRPLPVIRITQPWLSRLAALVRANGLRVMLDLNLAVHSPAMAASFARAAVSTLPRGSLAGLEIGNEPDLYWQQANLEKERIASTNRSTPRHWTRNYSPSDYRRDYRQYARALAPAVPHVPLGGPEIISAKQPWLSAVEGLGRLSPGFLTIHRYAASTCWPKSSIWYPTNALLLNESSSTGFAQTLTPAVQFAHRHHQALRLSEVNSVSCGGNAGVANSFATALWAPDVLFELIRAGIGGVSWHIRPNAINSPFHPTARGIEPMPELYGLAVFAQLTRPGTEVLDSALSSSPALHLKAWAVRSGGGLRVLLINKGPRAAEVSVRLGTRGPGVVSRLRAPRLGSRTGVTFAGQWIGSDARWHGRRATQKVRAGGGGYEVEVPGYSAAVLSTSR